MDNNLKNTKVELVSHKKVRVVIMLDEDLVAQIEKQVTELQKSSGRKNIRSEVYEMLLKGYYQKPPEKENTSQKEVEIKPKVSKKKQNKKQLNKKAKK